MKDRKDALRAAWYVVAMVVGIALMLQGCESMRTAQLPQSPEEAILKASGDIRATAMTLAKARDAGVITQEQTAQAQDYLQRAKDALGSAAVAVIAANATGERPAIDDPLALVDTMVAGALAILQARAQ